MLPPEVADRYARAGAWGQETIPARRARISAVHADRIALLDGDRAITFGEAERMIGRLAGALTAREVAGRRVAWLLANRWEAAVLHHAILAAGAVSAPLPPAWSDRELRAALAVTEPALLVTQAAWRGTDLIGRARGVAGAVDVLDIDDLPAEGRDPPPAPDDPAADAVLLFTSGTTSAPKGVLLSHRALLCEADSFVRIHALTPADRYLCGPPVSHIAGLAYGLLAPFALGTSTVFLSRWSPPEALAAIERRGVTFMTGPPTFLLSMADDPRAPAAALDSFRLFSTGGASIHEPALRRAAAVMGCTVKRAYGSTEIPTLTAGRLDDAEALRLSTDGRVIDAGEIRIVAGDADVPAGTEGEIWGRAPEMLSGYADPAFADALTDDGWLRTGDLGVLDEAGNLRVTGRLKDIIIRGGENISALEVEELLCAHPAVGQAAVIGLPDERYGERACACVVVRPGAALDFDAMVAHLRAAGLATFKLPERLEIVAELPVSETGKVRKADLIARFAP